MVLLLQPKVKAHQQVWDAGHEADSAAHEPWLTQMLEGRLEEEHSKRANAELELDRERAEIETLRQVIMDLESKHAARRAEWQVGYLQAFTETNGAQKPEKS